MFLAISSRQRSPHFRGLVVKYPAFDGTQNCAEIGPELFFPVNENPTKHVIDSIKQMCYEIGRAHV